MRAFSCFIASCFVLLDSCLLEAALPEKETEGSGSGRGGRWEGLEGVEEGETVDGMYHMREIYKRRIYF